MKGHVDIVKFLTVEKPLKCTVIQQVELSAKHHTALHLAAAQRHLDIVQFFISDQKIFQVSMVALLLTMLLSSVIYT